MLAYALRKALGYLLCLFMTNAHSYQSIQIIQDQLHMGALISNSILLHTGRGS